jgi:hypothetical protein
MLGRFFGLVGVSVVCVAACGGGAFSADDGEGDAGESNGGSGGKSSGGGAGKSTAGKGSGGNQTQAGNSSQGATGGDVSSGGMTNGGTNASGGVPGVSGTGGGMQGGSGGSVVAFMCETHDECPTSNSCHQPICDNGACDEVHVPDGPFHLQVAGDCKRMDCDDGEEKVVADLTDSNDNNECTIDSCSQNGVPTHKARFGEVCSNGGGTCNGEGQCVLCNRNNCPPAITCYAAICGNNGSCELKPRPAGDLCPHVNPNYVGDTYGQCDGTGVCMDCITSGGCQECCVCTLDHTCTDA